MVDSNMQRIFNKATEKKKRQILRNGMPKAEVILWSYLKDKQLYGYKFRRQYGVGPYVIDFYCPKKKLTVEVDGPSHYSQSAKVYDKHRQNYIESYGIKFIRITNIDVYQNIRGVIARICQILLIDSKRS